jgi:hypothetical protein
VKPYERAVAERLQAEAAVIALPPRERWLPPARRSSRVPLVAAATVVLALVVAGSAVQSDETPAARALAALRALVRPALAPVPADWIVFNELGLLGAVPPQFGAPTQPVIILGQPTGYLEFERGLSILLWRGSVRAVIDEPGWKGDAQLYTQRPMSGRDGVEVLASGIRWSDSSGRSGTYEARHLFVQVSSDLVADLSLMPPDDTRVPGPELKVSAEDRAAQDRIASYLRPVPDTGVNVDRTRVEEILRRVVRDGQGADVGAGDVSLTRLFSGQQWIYHWPNGSKSFAYIVVYPDRTQRERYDPTQSLVDWISPVSHRGVGNILVLVGSEDANFRYRLISALDEIGR